MNHKLIQLIKNDACNTPQTYYKDEVIGGGAASISGSRCERKQSNCAVQQSSYRVQWLHIQVSISTQKIYFWVLLGRIEWQCAELMGPMRRRWRRKMEDPTLQQGKRATTWRTQSRWFNNWAFEFLKYVRHLSYLSKSEYMSWFSDLFLFLMYETPPPMDGWWFMIEWGKGNGLCYHSLQNCSNHLMDHACNSEEEVLLLLLLSETLSAADQKKNQLTPQVTAVKDEKIKRILEKVHSSIAKWDSCKCPTVKWEPIGNLCKSFLDM